MVEPPGGYARPLTVPYINVAAKPDLRKNRWLLEKNSTSIDVLVAGQSASFAAVSISQSRSVWMAPLGSRLAFQLR